MTEFAFVVIASGVTLLFLIARTWRQRQVRAVTVDSIMFKVKATCENE